MRILRDSNPHARLDFSSWPHGTSQPKLARCAAQIQAIVLPGYPHCCGQSSRSTREIPQSVRSAILLHPHNALDGLDCPQQDSPSCSSCLAGHIQHEMHSIAEVHIRMAMLEIKRTIPWRWATIDVRRRIPGKVCLRLNNPPGNSPLQEFADHRFADQESRQLDRINGKVCTPKTPDGAEPHHQLSFYHTSMTKRKAELWKEIQTVSATSHIFCWKESTNESASAGSEIISFGRRERTACCNSCAVAAVCG
jgi:hypothetical protein